MAVQGIGAGSPLEKYTIEYESTFTVDEASAKAVKRTIDEISNTGVVKSGESALLRIEQDRLNTLERINLARSRESVVGNAAKIRSGEEALLAIEQARAETAIRINEAKMSSAVVGDAAKIRSGEEALLAIEASRLSKIDRINKAKSTSSVVGNAAGIRSGEEAILAIEQKRLLTAKALNAEKAKRVTVPTVASVKDTGVVTSGEIAAKELAARATKRLAAANEYTSGTFNRLLASQNAATNANREAIAALNGETAALNVETAALHKNTVAKQKNASTGTGGNTGGPIDELGQKKNSFGHKVFSTAQYTAAAAGIFAVASAFKEAGASIVEFDTASRTLSAVIQDLSLDKAKVLEKQLIGLGKAFGSSIEDINKSAILLGRAGIAQEDLIKSTEVVIKLSKITGDTLDSTSGAVISYLEVFGKAGETVDTLANKLAFMANESRLSTQDIETFSNFALAAADAAGLTVDSVSALATEFSKAGVNASTIGTQIRSLTKVFLDNSQGVKSFFADIGIVQANFQAELAAGGKQSNDAIVALSRNLASLTREEFNRVTASMDILQRNSLSLLRQQSEGIAEDIIALTTNAHDGIKAADVVLAGYVSNWEKLKAAMVDSIVSLDQTVGASGFIDKLLAFETLRINLQQAFLSDGISGATKVIKLSALSTAIRQKSLAVQKAEVEVATARNAAARIEAETRLQIAEGELLASQKRQAIINGEDPRAITNSLNEQVTAINENVIAAVESVQIHKERIALLDAEAKSSTVTASRLKEITSIREAEERSIKRAEKDLEAYNTQLDKAIKTKPPKDILALIGNTTKDTQALTTATLEFYKAGELAKGDAARPLNEIADSIAVIQSRIKELSSSKGVNGAFDGLLATTTDSTELLQANVAIYQKIKKVREEAAGGTQEEIEAANKIINAGKSIIEQNDLAIKQGNSILKIDAARLQTTERLLGNKRKTSIEEATQANLLVQNNLDTTDAVALAEAKLDLAEDIAMITENTLNYDKEGNVTKESALALQKALSDEKKAELDLTKQIESLNQKQIKNYTTQFNSQEAKIKAVQSERNSLNDFLGIEGELLSLENQRTQASIDRDTAIAEINRKVKEEGLEHNASKDLIAQQNKLYEEKSDLIDNQALRLSYNNQLAKESVRLLGDSLGSAIYDVTQGLDSWGDAAENFTKALMQAAIQLLVIKPLMDSIISAGGGGAGGAGFSIATAVGSFFGSANGNVYSSGSPDKRYATGGIVTRPVTFPQTDGDIGLMGEAGPEAILPLTRINGDLGVKAQVSGEMSTGSTEITIINESGIPMDLKETSRKKDDKGKEFVTMLMTTLNYNTNVRKAIKNL